MPVRTITIPSSLNVKDTVRGAKDPVMVGPSETLWNTRTPDGLGTLHLQRTSHQSMEAEAWGPGAEWMLDQAPRLLGREDDLAGFEPTGKIGEFWRRRPFRLGRTDRPWDSLIGAVFGQKVQVANAHKSRRMLARKFGDPAPGPAGGWVLPSPDRVAEMGYHQFHPLGVERKRAEILIRVAREMGRIGDLTGRSPASAEARLQRIRGIGPWTAAMVTASAMGHADAVPVGDYHIPNTIAWLLAGEPRATDQRMLELLEPYAGHRWRVIRLAKGNTSAPKYGPKLSLSGDGLHLGR
ncbi:MAG: DNA-3-methyladenine glycosylase family protein [Acidimicrobiales bacterium]